MKVFLGTLFLCALIYGSCGEEEEKRDGKKLFFPSVLQLVRFKNEACSADTRTGTCYTSEECSDRNGMAAGSCAHGYGVCCVFERSCGMTTNENCTLFTSSDIKTGPSECDLEVCPCGDNICQLRLDFTSFVITGPTTLTESVVNTFNGQLLDGLRGKNANPAIPVTNAGQCLTDQFFVNTPGGTSISPICGVNTGQHMYADASRSGCNIMSFSFGDTGVGTQLATRNFDIKITQIECDSVMRAPEGCLQYFTGTTGAATTFNYGRRHLANQDQNVCVRREGNNCRICWSAARDEFDISARKGKGVRNLGCCGYGRRGDNRNAGYECLIVPNPEKIGGENLPFARFCGNIGFITGDSNAAMAPDTVTICSTSAPFSVRFLSDQWENFEIENTPNAGIRVTYAQDSMHC